MIVINKYFIEFLTELEKELDDNQWKRWMQRSLKEYLKDGNYKEYLSAFGGNGSYSEYLYCNQEPVISVLSEILYVMATTLNDGCITDKDVKKIIDYEYDKHMESSNYADEVMVYDTLRHNYVLGNLHDLIEVIKNKLQSKKVK